MTATVDRDTAGDLRLTDVMDNDLLAISDPLDRIAATLARRDRRRAEAEMLSRLAGAFALAMRKKGWSTEKIADELKRRGVPKASDATVRRLIGLAEGRNKPAAKPAAGHSWTDAT